MAGLIELKINYQIPKNWTIIKIKPFIKAINGYPFASDRFTNEKNHGEPIVRIRDVLSGIASTYTDEHCPSEYIIDNGDILIGMDGDFNVNRWNGGRALLNQRVCSIKTDQRIVLEDYLYYFLPEFLKQINEITPSVTVKHLSIKTLENLQLPLAPIEEQKRIVEIIEKQFAKLDEARDLIQQSLDTFADRRSAILHKAFTGELTRKWREEKGILFEWEKCKIADIGELVTGSTPDTKNLKYYNGNFPFVKPADLNMGRNIIGSSDTLSEEGKKVSRVIRKGSTCVCCIGATIGKCGFLQVEATTNQQINSIIPYDFMDDLFVYYYCCSDDFKQRLIEKSSATTLPIISKKKMADLEMVVPSKSEQEEIVRILDLIFKKEDKSKELIDMLDRIDEMKKAILARAFRGELGTSNPTDESAIDLLRRILK